ncbi:GGDEF domain-containing response regulator [Pseudomarimonas arenosa]|uniref:diguanylate cyclase n=1 Tax=Pseudomarimonas arenosa TaxID=2774145 RepID=A0AAW3ZI22_9GAMM|nr:diguanylate cyclase [Pseudomarimonas arenosa]MBD8525643.1 diguanylate cyclase [Pseudomarimonas arenosa]
MRRPAKSDINVAEDLQVVDFPFPESEPRSGRVLLVDDDSQLTELLTRILGTRHEVLIASRGEQALQMCLQHRPDLLLLDLRLPDMDGLSVCRQLRAGEFAATPIIFITAGSEEETACWEAGGSDFVCKPINPLTLMHRVNAHLALKFQADSLQHLAYKDSLTGIANRRYFIERIEAECGSACRDGDPLSLLLIDLDCFKQYNDGYGHVAGDHSLARTARALHACLKRPSDFIARFGGEEFACLLPGTPAPQAERVAERMQAAISALAIEHKYSSVAPQLTLSIGLAQLHGLYGETSVELLERADQALYSAKAEGRNRIANAER